MDNEIIDLVRKYSPKRAVSPGSEIYYDLNIYGEDLFELFERLSAKYGADYSSINCSQIAPGEGAQTIAAVARVFGVRQYDSFTVRDLISITKEYLPKSSGGVPGTVD